MRWLCLVAVLLTLPFGRTARAESSITADEFALWRDYKDALTDPRVTKLKEKDRIPAISRNFKVPEKKLRDAIKKGDEFGEQVGPDEEKAVREALGATSVAGRLKEVKVDAANSHVVAYVTWAVDKPEQVNKEACVVAVKCAGGAAIARTISVRVVDGAEHDVFKALISREAALRITESRINDFADTRFIKLFEKVERTP
jgi:hypothetical protein